MGSSPHRRTAGAATMVLAVLLIMTAGCSSERVDERQAIPRSPTTAPKTVPKRSSTTTTTAAPTTTTTAPPTTTTTALPTTTTTVPPTTAPPPLTTPPPPPPPPFVPAGETIVATARAEVGSVEVFTEPGAPEPVSTLGNPSPEYGSPQTFVVRERRDGFARVVLPVRPNGSSGWVRESDVTLTKHNYRIDVSLSRHHFRVVRGGDIVLEGPAGIGTSDTPTPGGEYYTWVAIAPTNSGYGAYAYGLSGFSEQLTEFNGGNGRLGIHGTNDASSIGRDVSHGCIRISDQQITALVEQIGLPLGVPVIITA